MLTASPLYMQYHETVYDLNRQVEELKTLQNTLKCPSVPDPERVIANIPMCEVESPAPFSYIIKYAPMFDVLLPSAVHSIQTHDA